MSNAMLSTVLINLIVVALVMFSIVLHEIGHGFAALRMGDNTAKRMGRLSPNPLKHLDPFGSVLLPLMLAFSGAPIIGFAKPVPYDPRNFRNRKLGEVVVGLAGPATNLLLALIGAVLAYASRQLFLYSSQLGYWTWQVCAYFVQVNLLLMFFNLIPLPPLDGSSLIAPLLPDRSLETYYRIERYSMPVLIIVLIVLPWILHVNPVGWYLENTAGRLADILLGLTAHADAGYLASACALSTVAARFMRGRRGGAGGDR